MSNAYILLWLEAPLQSWGSDSKFGRRDTLSFPTKSGIYGMILAAMGARGEQRELLDTLSNCRQTVHAFSLTRERRKGGETLQEELPRQPFLMDFQMVGSGYDDKDPWEKMLIPKRSDGGAAVGGGSKMTYRYYLQDARFAVIQEVPEGMADAIEEAFMTPVFPLFLGRKNCVPSDLIFRGIFAGVAEAEARMREIAEEKKLLPAFSVFEDERDGDVIVLNDVPLQFGEWKMYRDRRVTVVPL